MHQHDHDPNHFHHRNEEPGSRRRRGEFPGQFPGGFGPGFPGCGPRGARFAAQFAEAGGHGPHRRPKGDVRAAIISLLSEEGTTGLNGYGIMKAIGEKTEGAWNPSPGSVYPTLQQLVDEGLVAATGDGRTTEYALTDEGRAYTAEHAEELGAWANGPRPSDASRELMQNAGRLMAVLGQFRFAASDEQRKAAAEKLEETRKALYLILAE